MIVTAMMFNVGMKNMRRRRMWNCAPFDAPFERYERRKTVRSSPVPSRVGARRVRNESPTRASPRVRRRATRRELRRYFSVWLVQTPSATRAMDGVNDRFGGHARRSRHIAGLVDDDEFPTDYRAELEIRLVQIARLEEALRDANARATNEMREEDVEAHMRKFREHLQNVQRELENVKRERDAYRREWEAADGPSASRPRRRDGRINARWRRRRISTRR